MFAMLARVLPMMAYSLLYEACFVLISLVHADFNVANLKRSASACVAVAHAALTAGVRSVLSDLL